MEQGNIYRELDEHGESARAWRRSVDAVGLGSTTGQTASFNLGWALAYSGDHAGAYEAARKVTNAPGVSKELYAAARFVSAGFAKANGDIATARHTYEKLVADYRDDKTEHYRSIAKAAADRLAELH